MATKKIDINELEKQYLEAEQNFKTLRAQLETAKKEEEEKKKAKLEAEKTLRYNEVLEAYKRFEDLKNKFIKDYGSFRFKAEGEAGDFEWFWKTIGVI